MLGRGYTPKNQDIYIRGMQHKNLDLVKMIRYTDCILLLLPMSEKRTTYTVNYPEYGYEDMEGDWEWDSEKYDSLDEAIVRGEKELKKRKVFVCIERTIEEPDPEYLGLWNVIESKVLLEAVKDGWADWTNDKPGEDVIPYKNI